MEIEGEGLRSGPPRDFGHLVVVVIAELLQQTRGRCSNFVESSLSRICVPCASSSCFGMVEMESFYRLLVALRAVYEL